MNGKEVIQRLQQRIAHINRVNDFDLAWRWAGSSTEPEIEVYEEADRHVLTVGNLATIHDNLTRDLSGWDLHE